MIILVLKRLSSKTIQRFFYSLAFEIEKVTLIVS